uniref:Cornetto n=1 Tax=Anopheles quadriannulatus TaxID=34691 RepID=A0A182XA35_ANOQN
MEDVNQESTIPEVPLATTTSTTTDETQAPNGDDTETGANETELEKLAGQDVDSTKSSMESSFTVTDCNCSSLIERTDQLDANELQLDAKVTELIEDLIKPPTTTGPNGPAGCEEKFKVLTIADEAEESGVIAGKGAGDGSDSGVEFGAGSGSLTDTGVLQRALSNNSAGYASSCCGLDGEPTGMSMSCNSSMISYSSDIYDKTGNTVVLCGRLSTDYCASEGGSESSSVTGGPVSSALRKAGSTIKKKVAVKEPPSNRSPRKSTESVSSSGRSSSRSRGSSLGRSVSLNLKTIPASAANVAAAAAARERARSRDKSASSAVGAAGSPSVMSTSLNRALQTPTKPMPPPRRPLKPDSLPTGIKDSPSGQRVTVSRTPSITRGRTPLGTPTDDGRWPSVGGKGGVSCSGGNTTPRSMRASSVAPDGGTMSIKTRIGPLSLDGGKGGAATGSPMSLPSGVDKFATLPRRRKERSAEDLKAGVGGAGSGSRSNSVTRDQSTNRMAVSLFKKLPASSKAAEQASPGNKISASSHPRLAAATKKLIHKTKIYHETSVQTAITGKDVEDAFGGNARTVRIDAAEMVSKQTQSDIRDKELERLEEKLKKVTGEYTSLMSKLSEKSQLVTSLEQKLLVEREEKLAAQRELQNNTDRVLGMLESMQAIPADSGDGGECDSLLMLESQLQLSGNVLEKKQEEIVRLQTICRALQMDMERSLKNQEELLRQKTELEEESSEMQDFLQVEKQSCMDALKEAEQEVSMLRQSLLMKEGNIERQQEECRHLVRIAEQRRQEYLGMQAKYNALESRSKDILLQQGAAVSGASVALSGLGSRLDNLVEQLIASYNISEQDLEDVIYHNEAYTNSASSGDGSPEYEQSSDAYSGKQHHHSQQHQYQQQQSPESHSASAKGGAKATVPLSPQRGQSFIAAVISAIKNATSKTATTKSAGAATNGTNAANKECRETNGHESDSTEMLDSETEPCLMMDNVLEDVTMPDSHSHNMVSSSTRISQIEMPSSLESGVGATSNAVTMAHDESLDNLSQAIANRQQIELQSNMIASGRSSRFHHSIGSNNDQQQQQHQQPSRNTPSVVTSAAAAMTTAPDHTTASHSSSLDDEENSCCAEASMAEMPSICEYCNAQSLVDQVIDVDNLITKLLKVLRIVQMDNDHCIQELINHKNKLAISNEEIQDRVKEYEELNYKLQDDLKDAYHQLQVRGSELSSNKVELLKHRQEIDKLNEDICQLSTLCSDSKQAKKIVIDREEILNAFKLCNEDGVVPEQELSQFIVQACTEIPKLKAKLFEKEQQLATMASNATSGSNFVMTASWHQALSEAKRQYEAIDRALETLDSIKAIVQQTPALMELQRDLEETNFASASSFPLVTAAQLNQLNCGQVGTNGNGAGVNGNGIIDLNANETTLGNEAASVGADPSCYIDSTA